MRPVPPASEAAHSPDWLNKRHRCIHLTIRDIDCADFDVDAMIATFREWHVSLFSFFAGGYITTYPTDLDFQRIAPGLGDRDLCGEIIESARRAGIIAFPMIDLGEIPTEVARSHPGWAAQRADGSFFEKTDGIVTNCPLGGYVREASRLMVREMARRYRPDGIKFGGASYGFAPGTCHCPACQKAWKDDTGKELPSADADPVVKRRYTAWREDRMRETVRFLRRMVQEEADAPMVGNLVWHLGRGMDVEELCAEQDFAQFEVQTRFYPTGQDDDPPVWERFSFPTETTRYVEGLTRRPPWVVASYFLAWPWRRVAVPAAEQFSYLAQVAANGGSPMVNLSGGPPAVHEDKRGFEAITRLYSRMHDNRSLFENDRTAAEIALVFNPESARAAEQAGDPYRGYLRNFQGWEDGLNEARIPFAIVSTQQLSGKLPDSIRCLIVPHAPALTTSVLQRIVSLANDGIGIICDGAPGKHAGDSAGLGEFETSMGYAEASSEHPLLESPHQGMAQAYARMDRSHPLCKDIEADLLAIAGPFRAVKVTEPHAECPLRRSAPFRLFPEGLSYPDNPDPAEPLAISTPGNDEGRAPRVQFNLQLGFVHTRTGHPDVTQLMRNAVDWVYPQRRLQISAAGDLLVSHRKSESGSDCIHLINTTGRRRFLDTHVPLRDVRVRLRTDHPALRARLGFGGADVGCERCEDGAWEARIPVLTDYEILVMEPK